MRSSGDRHRKWTRLGVKLPDFTVGMSSHYEKKLPRFIASIVGGSLLWRAHFQSMRVAEAKNAATINRLMSKRRSVLYFPNSTVLSRVKGHKGSPVLPRLLPSIVMGSLRRRAHFESLRVAEAKNAATINQLKYRSRSCITGNIALGAWSRANGHMHVYMHT